MQTPLIPSILKLIAMLNKTDVSGILVLHCGHRNVHKVREALISGWKSSRNEGPVKVMLGSHMRKDYGWSSPKKTDAPLLSAC